jgi:S-adenosylmethionine:tRNA ribosyltransferase-isomerase
LKASELVFDRPPALQATSPPESRGVARDGVRLLISSDRGHQHVLFNDLPALLPPRALLVVNRSAVLPASVPASGALDQFRVHLSTHYGGTLWLVEPRWSAARPGPLPLGAGEQLRVADLPARLVAPFPGLPRLWFVRIGGDVAAALAANGEPIRYSYAIPPYPPISAYQTIFADRPGSAESPSAARPFTHSLVNELHAHGIEIASVILHAGVSSLEVESDAIDDHVLFPEPFVVPPETAAAVNRARRDRRMVIAVGTTVVRALESAWTGTELRAASGFTRLFVRPGRSIATVDGLLTGFHDPRASHLAMLYAFAGPDLIRTAYAEAVAGGYLWHEFGDSHLLVPGDRPSPPIA